MCENWRTMIMLVCQNAEVNRNLGRITLQLYKDGYYHVSDAQPSAADDLSMKDGFYGAQLHLVLGYPASTARDHRELYPNRVAWI